MMGVADLRDRNRSGRARFRGEAALGSNRCCQDSIEHGRGGSSERRTADTARRLRGANNGPAAHPMPHRNETGRDQ